MKNGLLKLSLIVSLVLSASCLWAQNSFKVEAPNVVGEGERFLVKFVANGEVSNFTPPSFAGADVIAGPTTSTSWSSTIINGKRSSSYTKTYTYVLEASDQETVTVSSASAEIEGTSYTTKSLTIEIVKGSSNQQSSSQTQTQQAQPSAASSQAQTQSRSQDYDDDPGITYGKADLFLRLSLNKTKVFKGEPVTAVLKIYTRSNIVGFEDIKFPVFNGFWSQETEAPQNLNFVREKVGNQIYNSAVIRRYMLMPQKSGTLTIDPAEMVCQVEVTSRPRGRSRPG